MSFQHTSTIEPWFVASDSWKDVERLSINRVASPRMSSSEYPLRRCRRAAALKSTRSPLSLSAIATRSPSVSWTDG